MSQHVDKFRFTQNFDGGFVLSARAKSEMTNAALETLKKKSKC